MKRFSGGTWQVRESWRIGTESQDGWVLEVDGTKVSNTGKRFMVSGHPCSTRNVKAHVITEKDTLPARL